MVNKLVRLPTLYSIHSVRNIFLLLISGGIGSLVHIDETHLGAKLKYNRGWMHPGLDIWLLGIDTTMKTVIC